MDPPRLSGYLWAEGVSFFSLEGSPAAGGAWHAAAWLRPAQPVLDRVRTARALKVCIWPEYYGVTYRHHARKN